jgi:hypothetical protein
MAENQTKRSIFKRILRWIWLIILTIVFVPGVIFQTPLKILALTAIFILAATVLPSSYRKWFWAVVGVVIIALTVWVFLPDNNDGWKPYTFVDELAKLEIKNKIPDGENAAFLYDKLIADFNHAKLEPNFITDKIDNIISEQYWSSKDFPQVAEWINTNKPLMDRITDLLAYDNCRLIVKTDELITYKEHDPVTTLRNWAYLLEKASNNDVAEGRINEGLLKIYCISQIGNHQRQQSSLINLLTGIAIDSMAMGRLIKMTATQPLEPGQLDGIEQYIKNFKYDWQTDVSRVIDYDKMFLKNMSSAIIYEVNKQGKIRFYRYQNCFSEPYLKRKYYKARTILKWLFMPSSPQELSKIMDAAFEQNYNMANSDFDWNRPFNEKSPWYETKSNYQYFMERWIGQFKGNYYAVHDCYERKNLEQRGALLVIALKRYKNKYNEWPKSLEDIKNLTIAENFIDSENGQSFVYKINEKGFVLYSKGKNGIDENGEREYKFDKKTRQYVFIKDDISIWDSNEGGPKKNKKKIEDSNEIE